MKDVDYKIERFWQNGGRNPHNRKDPIIIPGIADGLAFGIVRNVPPACRKLFKGDGLQAEVVWYVQDHRLEIVIETDSLPADHVFEEGEGDGFGG